MTPEFAQEMKDEILRKREQREQLLADMPETSDKEVVQTMEDLMQLEEQGVLDWLDIVIREGA